MKKFTIVILFLIIITIVAVVLIWDKKQSNGLKTVSPQREQTNMKIESLAFEHEKPIPSKYTCDGENISPPILISDVPERARSLVMIMSDPDAIGGDWVHWTMWNIPVNTTEIPEGTIVEKATEGITSFGNPGYGGPCPPSGEHRYIFKLYAIGSDLYLDYFATKNDLMDAMDEYIIETAELIGTYSKK